MLALGAFSAAFALAYLGTVLLLRLPVTRRFVDVPSGRSSHDAPKSRLGGVAIGASFFLVFGLLLLLEPAVSELWPLLVGGGIVFATGLLDDRRALPVVWRLVGQCAGVVVVVGSGHVVDHVYVPMAGVIHMGVAAVPFTILFLLASINFYNFIDGIDGLAAGNGLLAAGFLALIAHMLGHTGLSLACLAVAGITLGFLQFNFPPSRLFMGDAGSTFLGFFFAFVAVAGNELQPEIPFFIPVLILSSLYLDAALTLTRRAFRGEKIFQPHRTHYYQRLLSLGFNHKQVTVVEYGLTFLLGVSALVFIKAGGFFPFFLTLSWVVVFAALILKIRGLERGDRLFWEKRSLLVIGGDLLMIAIAYFGAYFLRMNFRFTDPEGTAVLRAFPLVLVVRSACFYGYGLYRGVWKYTSTPDVLRIIKAVTTGSIISIALVVLFYRFVAFPRSLFIIEYVLLIAALAGSRFAFRLFHEFGQEALGANRRRVAIIGAGDRGERVAREIRNADGKSVSVVCYVDDDKEKVGLVLRGVPIAGPIDDLADICKRFDVHSLVLGISNLSDDKLKMVLSLARETGVRVEGRTSGYTGGPIAGPLEFDRIRQAFGRTLPTESLRKSLIFFEGKRVLITHGGGDIGPDVARELARAGAHVAVQITGHEQAGRYADIGACEIFAGSIERELDAARVFDGARPEVVFHCTTLGVGPIVNRPEYLWRRMVRTTDTLRVVVPRHPVESIVFVNFWDDVSPEDPAATLSAAAEIMAINSSDLLPSAPKILRLGRVLTRRRLTDLTTSQPGERNWSTYSLLIDEAVAMCIDAAATYKGRVILVPHPGAPLPAADVAAVLRNPLHKPAIDVDTEQGSLFPNEDTKASILVGAREVVSPSYPADDGLIEAVAGLLSSSQGHGDIAAVRAALFERAGAR